MLTVVPRRRLLGEMPMRVLGDTASRSGPHPSSFFFSENRAFHIYRSLCQHASPLARWPRVVFMNTLAQDLPCVSAAVRM